MKNTVRLGVNIDHVATLRQVRGVDYPNPVDAAIMAIQAGADGITLHLREDRRHIQDSDLIQLKNQCTVPINLEMALTDEMLKIARQYQPENCCLVPEKREELTTEGGLDVQMHEATIKKACWQLKQASIQVSLFIDPVIEQINAAVRCEAPVIEIHTGHYANATSASGIKKELARIETATQYAHDKGIIVNAGHGLHYDNVQAIASIPHIHELNIGHSLIAQAVFDGLPAVVKKMKQLIS
jgi:pyridoxine 5-phosphate synthase